MRRRSDDTPPAEEVPGEPPSRSARKRESEALQDLGAELLTLKAETFAALELPAKLRDAIEEARRLAPRGALRRQLQFIGKLMRAQDDTTLAAIRHALEEQHQQSVAEQRALHGAELWRTRLLADDEALAEWVAAHPATDVQHLRALLRQARKEEAAATTLPDGLPRHGKAYRSLFQLLKQIQATTSSSSSSS